MAAARGHRPEGSRGDFWRSLLTIVAVFFLIRIFLVEAYRIPSGSMEPTLLVGDMLFVNKLIYGPHIPFTDINLPGYATPKRGSVVVYRSPDDRDGNPTVVKRLVGLAGDTLYMRRGVLYVNGMEQRLPFRVPPADPIVANGTSPDFEWQKAVALRGSRFGAAPAQPTHDNWGPFVVPQGRFFSLGDNRYNSKDARYYGFVPLENLRGKPMFIYYSFRGEGSDSPLPFITDPRWGRIGMRIR